MASALRWSWAEHSWIIKDEVRYKNDERTHWIKASFSRKLCSGWGGSGGGSVQGSMPSITDLFSPGCLPVDWSGVAHHCTDPPGEASSAYSSSAAFLLGELSWGKERPDM